MSNHVVAIGGSGARCAEAFVYLCAAGLGPQNRHVELLFVDPDQANFNLERAKRVADLFASVQGNDRALTSTTLSTKTWSPLQNQNETFADALSYSALQGAAGHLLDLLTTPEERDVALNIGFRARPSIGSAIFTLAAQAPAGQGEDAAAAEANPWAQIRASVAQGGGEVRVFAMGSTFGGTGAAGLPTVPKLIRPPNHGGNNLTTGCALLLPYFGFPQPANQQQAPHAEPAAYLANAYSALKYYARERGLYDRLYVLGCDAMPQQHNFSLGGASQDNRGDIVEMLAALATCHFLRDPQPAAGQPVCFVSRQNDNAFEWTDLNWTEDQVHLNTQVSLGAFTRTCLTYLTRFYPVLRRIRDGDSDGALQRVPWYVELKRRGFNPNAESTRVQLDAYFSLCLNYLRWLADLQHLGAEAAGGLKVELVAPAWLSRLLPCLPSRENPGDAPENELTNLGRRWLAVESLDLPEDSFPVIMLEGRQNARSLRNVWIKMCDQRQRGRGSLFTALSQACT